MGLTVTWLPRCAGCNVRGRSGTGSRMVDAGAKRMPEIQSRSASGGDSGEGTPQTACSEDASWLLCKR